MHNFGVTAGDGNVPSSGLIVDAAGNYYGVTRTGGAHNAGIVYQLSPVRGGGWNETILYNFKGGASDGSGPSGLLLRDSAGNLYGTAQEGGLVSTQCTDFQNSTVGCGIVFKLARTTTGQWTETVLHRFTGGTDGGNPNAGLVRDKAGNLYGTAAFGGVGKAGTVFKLSHTHHRLESDYVARLCGHGRWNQSPKPVGLRQPRQSLRHHLQRRPACPGNRLQVVTANHRRVERASPAHLSRRTQ
jgi:hypothetical protein